MSEGRLINGLSLRSKFLPKTVLIEEVVKRVSLWEGNDRYNWARSRV